MKTQILSVTLALFIGAGVALAHQMLSLSVFLAHGGVMDRNGCHLDAGTGNYHCHQGLCAGRTFASQEDMLKMSCATRRNRVP